LTRRAPAGQVPLADRVSPAAVLRLLPATGDRPRPLPRVQGPPAPPVQGAAGLDRGRGGHTRPQRQASQAAGARLDADGHRRASRDPRRRRRGWAHRLQSRTWPAHADQGAEAQAHVPELDELAALIDAASEQDISLGPGVAPIELGLTAAQVARLHGQGKTPTQLARQLGPAKSTVSHHLKRLGLKVGPRASELCGLKIGHMRLHDPHGARFRIPDAKTERGYASPDDPRPRRDRRRSSGPPARRCGRRQGPRTTSRPTSTATG
jgi:hypothetical protein